MKALTYITSIALATFFISSCKPGSKNDKQNADSLATVVKPVKVSTLALQEISLTETYPATIQAWQEAHIGPSQPGKIRKMFVKVGAKVSEGTLLAEMDPTTYNQIRLQFQDAKRDKQRMDSLIKYGNVSQQTYDKVKLQYEVLQSNLQTMGENVFLRAPFSGVITGKYYNDGENYSGMPGQNGVSAIFTIMQMQDLKVIINISERYFPLVKTGMPISILSDIYKDKTFEGKIETIYPTVDATSKTFKIEIRVKNQDQTLRPGMFAKAVFDFGKTKTMVVSANTVLKQDGTNERYVFMYNKGVAKRINVLLGARFNDKIEIVSDKLTEGAQIITTGHAGLIDGSKVAIK